MCLMVVIKPMTCHPHTRNVKKTDVVSRFNQYRNSWSAQKAPGENNRHSLRWNVRGNMLYHDEVVEKVLQLYIIVVYCNARDAASFKISRTVI